MNKTQQSRSLAASLRHSQNNVYTIKPATARPHLDGQWDSPIWQAAETAHIAWFHPMSSDHHPDARARVLYSDEGLHIIFRVLDRYVRSITTDYMGPVYKDACVEFFVQPRAGKGYFNFEMNCGGTLLLSYVTEVEVEGKKKKNYEEMPWEYGKQVEVFHSMPKTVEPEHTEAVEWRIEYRIPFGIFEKYLGPLGNVAGQEWRGNFYKCAENNSHPHWGAWSPVGEQLNFHQPDKFGVIKFA
ncbi:MAG: carbohydrate-binding family 9-like protein [Candidatus Hydrogenedentes bacterium]|nr:carbohydrate-binding family 9-like protein [Candidatus Hydrogenedentota bacterium]